MKSVLIEALLEKVRRLCRNGQLGTLSSRKSSSSACVPTSKIRTSSFICYSFFFFWVNKRVILSITQENQLFEDESSHNTCQFVHKTKA